MTPFVASRLTAIIEDLRLLEAFVTAPLGLYSDIRMLRQSIPLEEAADLPQEENQRRRLGYRTLTDDPLLVSLETMAHARSTLALLQGVRDGDGHPLSAEWSVRAGRVIDRAEQRVAGELRVKTASRIEGLYVIVDPALAQGRPATDVAEAAIRGGARVIQLRDKGHKGRNALSVAREMKSMCDEHGALFIMNDDPSLALSSEAHGLHLGQRDLPVPEARRVLGPTQIVGSSNGTIDEVSSSQGAGVDYLAVGPIFESATIAGATQGPVGKDMVSRVKEFADQPLVAVGGIDRRNVADVVQAGADCIAVAAAVTLAEDPEAAARALAEAIQDAKT